MSATYVTFYVTPDDHMNIYYAARSKDSTLLYEQAVNPKFKISETCTLSFHPKGNEPRVIFKGEPTDVPTLLTYLDITPTSVEIVQIHTRGTRIRLGYYKHPELPVRASVKVSAADTNNPKGIHTVRVTADSFELAKTFSNILSAGEYNGDSRVHSKPRNRVVCKN